MSAGDKETQRIRRGQLVLFSGLAALVLVVFAAWFSQSGGKAPAPVGGIEAELAGPDAAEAGWVRRSEVRIGGIENRLREIETRNLRLEQENARLQAQLRENAADARIVIDRQAAHIDAIEARAQAAPIPGQATDGLFLPAGAVLQASVPAPAVNLPAAPMMLEFELAAPGEGEAPEAGEAAKPLGAYVPAGSYAEAVVLAGADASVGVASQSDPRPVLLRLTGPARTAAGDGVAAEVDVEGCTVTGAAYGDLSSEKVYVRLQTLTCTGEAAGTAVETQVAGFVAGAGKAGVRGPVVSREGALVEKAFLAGLVSGLGQGVNGAFQPQAAAAQVEVGLGDIGRAGLGAGAGAAGQKVSDYLIRRAEQYQPVVQLQAGTRVTVVFLEGAWLDGRGEKANG